jgi:hypothetical protein
MFSWLGSKVTGYATALAISCIAMQMPASSDLEARLQLQGRRRPTKDFELQANTRPQFHGRRDVPVPSEFKVTAVDGDQVSGKQN